MPLAPGRMAAPIASCGAISYWTSIQLAGGLDGANLLDPVEPHLFADDAAAGQLVVAGDLRLDLELLVACAGEPALDFLALGLRRGLVLPGRSLQLQRGEDDGAAGGGHGDGGGQAEADAAEIVLGKGGGHVTVSC